MNRLPTREVTSTSKFSFQTGESVFFWTADLKTFLESSSKTASG